MKKLTADELSHKRLSPRQAATRTTLPLTVILENVRSLYNVGSIFRTSDAAAIGKLVLTGFTPVPPRREIDKTALGATQSVRWEYIENPVEAVKRARLGGERILCLEQTDESRPYTSLQKAEFPLCLVVGNEVTGVSPKIVAECDGAIEIPMFGVKHSLNVAVAFGIAVFEILRLFNAPGNHPSKDFV